MGWSGGEKGGGVGEGVGGKRAGGNRRRTGSR